MCCAAQVGTLEGKLTGAQRKEALLCEEAAVLRKQLEQRAAEAQHCNAKAEVHLSDDLHPSMLLDARAACWKDFH